MIAGKAGNSMQEQMMKIEGHAMELSAGTGEMEVQARVIHHCANVQ